MKRSLILITFVAIMLLVVVSNLYAGVPNMINYQGRLTDTDGQPVEDDLRGFIFRIYDDSIGGNELWSTDGTVWIQVTDGLFSWAIGTSNPIPDSISKYNSLWLGIKVEADSEIQPRTQLASVNFAFKSLVADSAAFANVIADNSVNSFKIEDGSIQFADIGPNEATEGQVMKWDGNSWVAQDDSVGSGSSWSVTDSVLYTNNCWGIARGGADNSLWGDSAHTAVNLGILSATGAQSLPSDGFQTISGGWGHYGYGRYSVIGGGKQNTAVKEYCTVGGGGLNRAWNEHSTVGGGYSNLAEGANSTVGGGWYNRAEESWSTVGGGYENTAAGSWSTIAGGWDNTAEGSNNSIGGGNDNSTSNSNSTVSGGRWNIASGSEATVGGGDGNEASNSKSTVAGGNNNTASGGGSTVCAGQYNVASNYWSTVTGGLGNNSSGKASFIGGGDSNSVAGDYSAILGGHADTIFSDAHFSYLFGINSSLTEDSTFMVDMPHIRFGDETDGYEFPESDGSADQVMATDGNGQLNWIDPSSTPDTDWMINGNDVYHEAGHVGIGTTSPQAQLHILKESDVPEVYVDYGIGGQKASLHTGTDGTALCYSNYLDIATITGPQQAGFTRKAIFDNDGNLGIGTTAPSEKLHVVGNICYTGGIGGCSDVRYKKDIETIDSALEKVTRLRGVTYNWKQGEYPSQKFDDETHFGFVAQEIKELLPSVVMTDDNGYMSVDYSRVTPLLVEAIKEQQSKIDELTALVKQLLVERSDAPTTED